MKVNIYDILFWIFFILAVGLILWYIFGNSPTLEQALLVLIITFLFKIQSNLIHEEYEIKELKKKFILMESSFIKLAKDFKEHIRHKYI